ncbi:methyl-accepting chemotaxis protein [Pseudomonas sp. EMN2]|uniref:methyl-accepting chemotaxis protein n=1 Tax=Pseudomonas sp. EMN2 TaxID=2615212 RepID=UPI00129BFD3D|nr:methyl-accepting chemotaxis protein [Pseudomonas sp. EMN2]
MKLRNIRIGVRAALGFTIIILLAIVMASLALTRAKHMDEATEQVRGNWLPAVLAIGDIANSLGRSRALTLRSIVLTDQAEKEKTIALVKDIHTAINRNLENYRSTIADEEDMKLYKAFEKKYESYSTYQDKVIKAVLMSPEEAILLANGPLADYSDDMMKALSQLVTYNTVQANNSTQESVDAYQLAIREQIIALVAIVIAMIIIAFILTRSIVSPLTEAARIANNIASGCLTNKIDTTGMDETSELLKALNKMQFVIHETIDKIATTANQLACASEELHAVTTDTKSDLNQQHNELEQAATAVNEMSYVIEEVANNATATAHASKNANLSTQTGKFKIHEALDSVNTLAENVLKTSTEVENLSTTASHVNTILIVIRSIAEQTNLLALNAAIEAARAGDAGRGFAVVADEVRALAFRTQQSTSEIEQMIASIQDGTSRVVVAMSESQDQATNTVDVARSASEVLDGISTAIASINERNLVIASASEEQALATREVDKSLASIRDLSTQTSAGANHTSAASHELSQLAGQLREMTSKFST